MHLNFKTFIMKKTLTIFFVFISIFTFAQSNSWDNSESETKSKSLSSKNEETYLPFFADLPKTYNITHAMTCYSPDYNPSLLGLCCETFDYTLDSNNRENINNKEYFIFDPGYYGTFEPIYLREDLQTGVIYRYYSNLDTEAVWCDMRLSVGDTFFFPHPENYNSIAQNNWWEYSYVSDDYMIVDTVFYDNFGRKNIHFSKNQILVYPYEYYDYGGRIQTCFIEGIGPTYGPAGFINHGESLLGALLCVHQSEDSLIYMMHPDLGCYQDVVGIEEHLEDALLLYPNPATHNLHLHFDGEQIRNGRCIISNVSGIVVKTVRCHENDWDINVSDLTPGLYFLRYEDAKGYTVKKFVKN